jgi:Berberine and berberine like
MFHPLNQARAILERGRAEMAAPGAPDALLWTSFLRKAPPVPWMPEELIGVPGVMSLVEWSGEDAAEGVARLAVIRDDLAPTAASLEPIPFLAMQTITDDIFAAGQMTYIKAGFVTALTDATIDALLAQAATVGSPLSQIEVLAMGGAIARVDADATAFPHRDAAWLLNVPAMWTDPADTGAEVAWARETYKALEPHMTGGTYVNFMAGDETTDSTGVHARTRARLESLKAAYDPENVFRLNQNIKPAPAAAAG